ncbi:MAG TPA: tetratricopeptide repeat protein, partial [Thermoplasmata archaeon]|nr:tetratricopeptide repeat protein [Thermoplasmata archaeon]
RAAGRPDLVKEFARAIVDEEPTDLATREELAKSLVSEGDAAAALEEYRQLAAADPREARYLYEERALLTTLGRPGELAPVYARLFELDPANSELAFDRGRFSLEAARTAAEGSSERLEAARAAVASFERSASEPKFSEGSLLGLADAARLSGDPTRAIRAYEEFLAKPESSSNTKVLKELGHALREQGRFEEAASTYDRALGLGLEDPDLLWGEVEVLAETNADGKALRYIDILSQRDPANLLYRRRKGQLLLRAGRRAEGIRVLREVAETARTDPVALFEVAHALRSDGDYAEAIESYREGLKADPAHRAGRIAFAETLNLAGRYNEALPIVDALLNEEPNDLAAWKARADSCRALGRTGDLEYSLKAILLLDPTHSPALVEKYRLHLGEGQKLEALECLTQFLDAGGPESGNTALLLEAGDLAAELGRTDEAGRLYERASELDPGQRGAIGVRKARMRLSAGRPDLALEVLDGATPAGTDAAPGSESLRGDILMAMERPAEAESVYRAILARDPSAPLVLLGLARALLDQGKHAEARTLLVEAIPKAPPTLGPFLLLAESESGLGSAPNAIRAIQKGLEVLPDSKELWTRLGELEITQEAWPDAAAAFGNAVRIDPANPSLLLKAGYVAERLGHRTEALSLYERATQSGPSDKQTWTSRGLALLANDRPEEATASFDRALALDSDFDPAKQGRKAAVERTREAQVDRFGREALLLEARLHRTVTKNDLFVTLHVPFDFLEPVLSGVTRDPKVDLSQLDEAQLHQLETASYQIITAALDRRSEGVERRGFSLADVAVLSPSGRSLKEIQQLFGYLRAVLEVELRPENLKLEPDVEELARRALLLPAEQRTLFQIVRNLKVGIFRARLIKVVESSGSAVHAPLPSLDLGAYTPEFRTDRPSPPAGGEPIAEVEPPPPMEAPAKPSVPSTPPADKPMPSAARCVGCGGLASILHACGAPVCAHCVVEFGTCPKCRLPASLPTNPTPPPTAAHHRASSGPIAESGPTRGTLHALKQVVARA